MASHINAKHSSSRVSLLSNAISEVASNNRGPSDNSLRLNPNHVFDVVETPKSAFPQTATTTVPQTQAPDIPEGGLTAWLQVLGCFFCWFNSWCDIHCHFTFAMHIDMKTGVSPMHSECSKHTTKPKFCGIIRQPKYLGSVRSNHSCWFSLASSPDQPTMLAISRQSSGRVPSWWCLAI